MTDIKEAQDKFEQAVGTLYGACYVFSENNMNQELLLNLFTLKRMIEEDICQLMGKINDAKLRI